MQNLKKNILGSALVALSLSACSNHTADTSATGSASNLLQPSQADKFLIVGNTAHFAGTETVQITFAAPSATRPNSFASYSTSEVATVSAAPAGISAAFDVHREITYTPILAPQYGVQLQSQIVDGYLNVIPNPNTGGYAVVSVGGTTNINGLNISASVAAPSGAPYSYVENVRTNFLNPSQVLSLPLSAGDVWNLSLARSVNRAVSTTSIASSALYSGANLSAQFRPDNSYSLTGQNGLNSNISQMVNSDGSGSQTLSDATTSAVTRIVNIGAPLSLGGGYVIPVSWANSSTAIPSLYNAFDWYVGGGAITAALGSSASNVIGAVSVLPADCTYSGPLAADVVEYEVTTSNTDPVAGGYTVTNSQIFSASGITVCALSKTTAMNYSITTGALIKSQVTTIANSLLP